MCFSSPSAPAAPATPQTATVQDVAVTASRNSERSRQAAALGRSSTILSGGSGLTSTASTAPKTLLGA